MKRLLTFALSILFLSFTLNITAQNYDYLLTATNTGSGVTTNNSKAWTDLTSVTVDVTNISYLYLSATINMRPDGASTNGREGNYNIYQSDDPTKNSGIIKRQMVQNSEPGVESWGVGTLIHVFDVSTLSGNKTFTIEHSNQGVSQTGRNVYSYARLSAVSLTTKLNANELSHDNKTLSSYVTTTSSTYVPIAGLETDAISLPFKGDIFVALSINGKSNAGGTVAEYKLEYSTDNGVTYTALGKKVKRTMYNTWDDGIVSLTAILQDQEPGNTYKIRVLHERELGSGIVSSGNANLVAIALNHEGGGYFESVSSETTTGSTITGVSTPSQNLTTNSFTTPSDINGVSPQFFVSSQYLVTASGLNTSVNPVQRMRGLNQLYLSDGATTINAEPYYRYISSNGSYGAGGFVGLTEALGEQTLYTLGMEHNLDYVSNPDGVEDEGLTTSEVILCGFQTFDQPHYLWNGNVSTAWELDANWAYGKAPTASTHEVTIPSAVNSPIISGSTIRECGLLNVRSGASIQISDNATLQPADAIVNDGNIILGHNSSLLQTIAGVNTNSGNGDYTVVRTGGNSAYGYNIWSSPIDNAYVPSVFTGTNPCDIWVFDQSNQVWSHDYLVGFTTSCYGNPVTFTANDVISSGNGIMDIGGGYFTPGGTAPTKTFYGNVNNGDINVPISATTLGNPGGNLWGDDDWNLVGNPYPSAIDASEFWAENATENTRIINGIYFWDDADTSGGYNQNSDYASWNLSGGVNSGNSSKIPSGYISSGQGFWVYAAATTNLVFNNSMRSNNNDQFFKTEQTDKHNVWISFTSPSSYQNNILVGYNNNSTDGVDANYDANKLPGNVHVRFASMIDQNEYVIQSIAPLGLGESKIVPLVVFTDEKGLHTFAQYKRENIPAQMHIYLRDHLTGVTHDLAAGTYEVFLHENIDYTNRFDLVFERSVSTNDQFASEKAETSIINSTSDSEYTNTFNFITTPSLCTVTNEAGIQGDVTIIDVTGKTIWSSHQAAKVNSIEINISNLSSGVYILQIRNAQESVFHKKFYK